VEATEVWSDKLLQHLLDGKTKPRKTLSQDSQPLDKQQTQELQNEKS
jgi:hypothetical protein